MSSSQIWQDLLQCMIYRGHYRSSRPRVFLGKGVLNMCIKFTGENLCRSGISIKLQSKFTEEHPCRIGISIKLQSNFTEIALRHGCSPVNLLHISKIPFYKNTCEWLLLPLHEASSFLTKLTFIDPIQIKNHRQILPWNYQKIYGLGTITQRRLLIFKHASWMKQWMNEWEWRSF